MVRFSCFQPHTSSHRHKKTSRRSGEAMPERLKKDEENNLSLITDSVTDHSSAGGRECKSDDVVTVQKNPSIRKSLSLGNVLNWEEPSDDASGGGIEKRSSSAYPQIGGGSEDTKNASVFSKEAVVIVEDHHGGGGDPKTTLAKSSSVPRMAGDSLDPSPELVLSQSRSVEDLNAWDFGKVQQEEKGYGEEDVDNEINGRNCGKDWTLPEPDEEGKDFKLKRIEEWVVTTLQYTQPLEEDEVEEEFEIAPSSYDHSSEGQPFPDKPKPSDANAASAGGAEAAKRYISCLNPSAAAAQLANLRLVVVPFLGAFVGLKALNLSGNAISRIAAGALPRGLHLLNLSRNSISAIEGLRDLTRLRVLDLSYNRILRIGHGLAGCSSLKEVYLAGNKISEVDGLHRLLKLNVLDVRSNKISTTKCIGQLAANYKCLHAVSLEGNPAQKNVGDEALKKYLVSLLPNLTHYNRQPVQIGGTDRAAAASSAARLGGDDGMRSTRRGGGAGPTKSGRVRPPPSGMRTSSLAAHQLAVFSIHRTPTD